MIKLFACFFMLIDHLGLVFFPELIELRLVGRLAMPLFAYSLALGVYYSLQKNTFNLYMKRMLIFAVVSQLPYMLMVGELRGNIGFLWITCMIFLKKYSLKVKTFSTYIIMCLCVLTLIIVPIDYGIYGFGFVLLFYFYYIKSFGINKIYLFYFLLHGFLLSYKFEKGLVQLFTLPSISLIKLLSKYDKVYIKSSFFYIFYPLHITVIIIIKFLLGR